MQLNSCMGGGPNAVFSKNPVAQGSPSNVVETEAPIELTQAHAQNVPHPPGGVGCSLLFHPLDFGDTEDFGLLTGSAMSSAEDFDLRLHQQILSREPFNGPEDLVDERKRLEHFRECPDFLAFGGDV